jgi:glycosyltransferase involved in cell wall biosynthesis
MSWTRWRHARSPRASAPSRCPSGSSSSSASSRRTRAPACSSPRWRPRALGEGSLAHALKFEAAAAGVTVLLRGWAEREDVLRALARATALVFPSVWPEPLSRVLLEALALGTPVAAMDTGGTREILGETGCGLLVTEAPALADAVGRIAGDAALRDRLGEAARARAEAFSPAALVPRYEAVYRRLA